MSYQANPQRVLIDIDPGGLVEARGQLTIPASEDGTLEALRFVSELEGDPVVRVAPRLTETSRQAICVIYREGRACALTPSQTATTPASSRSDSATARGPMFLPSCCRVSAVTVRAAVDVDRVAGWVRRSWGDTVMAVHGQLYDVATLPALVAVADDRVLGVLTYVVARDALEIVSCDAEPAGLGVGRVLVDAAVELARTQGLRRVWCTTSNDNLPALGFWQAVGFTLIALRPDAVAVARRLKPSIPTHGYRRLAIRDELDLEFLL